MQAMVIDQFGGPEQLVLRDIPTPVPQEGEVLIKVRAFGINRAETQMRAGTWFEAAPVSGIECVGQVEYDPGGSLVRGQTVAAIMGGMGRTRNGSYADIRVCLRALCFLSRPIWTGQPWLPSQNPTRRHGIVCLTICASGLARCSLCAAEHRLLDRQLSMLPGMRV